VRRSSLDGYHSPDRSGNGFFPHDLDDIYEYKTDHQYFTHTGGTSNNNNTDRFSLSSDAQRNLLFRNQVVHSMDESNADTRRARFDNSSFIKNLNSAVSQNSVDSGNQSGSSNNSKEKLSSKSHHHHSIHEMIKHFGKKVHIWPRNRHDSINENEISNSTRNVTTPEPEPENFRSRSKSLDVTYQRKLLDDCESTYKIYNRILKEGKPQQQLLAYANRPCLQAAFLSR
jgi:5'-AMP-activated protein kinase regulatory gamma subunit